MALEMGMVRVLAKPGWTLLCQPILEAMCVSITNATMCTRFWKLWRKLVFRPYQLFKNYSRTWKHIQTVLNNLEHVPFDLFSESGLRMPDLLFKNFKYLHTSNAENWVLCYRCTAIVKLLSNTPFAVAWIWMQTMDRNIDTFVLDRDGRVWRFLAKHILLLYMDDIITVRTCDLCESRKQIVGQGTVCLLHAVLLMTWWWHSSSERMQALLW